MALSVLGPGTGPSEVRTAAEAGDVRVGFDLPCKNVDLQTRAHWRSSQSPWSALDGGYRPLSIVTDPVQITTWLQKQLVPSADPGDRRDATGGWFFSIPPVPQPPPALESRLMMRTESTPFGSVINLNPSCFGEVYWVGGVVGSTYMAFAVWVPYGQWVGATLPVIVHFRPAYNAAEYLDAAGEAAKQGAPQVLATDSRGNQAFLDGAWYYVLGHMAFVQQLLSVMRTAIVVAPIPPRDIPASDHKRGSLFPDSFVTQWSSVVLDAVGKAVDRASGLGAGRVNAATDQFILTGNSRGGLYLLDAVRAVSKGVREIWMFDSVDMHKSWDLHDAINLRLYVAQPGTYRSLLQQGGYGSPWEREGNDWSVVDVSRVPAHGDNLHDLCGRACFSHAAALSSHLPALKPNPKLLGVTVTEAAGSCGDRLEFWQVRVS